MNLGEHLARQPPGYDHTIGRVLTIYAGLMVTLLLAALDQTIVATALPRIVSDLGGITQYSWVFTAYMLTSTVSVPVYGRLGDVHGRRSLMLIAVTIFVVGSALCGAAQNMTELVICRGIQGLGAGGLFPLTLAVVGSIVPPRDRGRWQGLLTAVFAAASILGPAVGGVIVDNTTWRWIFLVNLPIGGIALVVISLTMSKRKVRAEHEIDWAGAALLATGTASLLLGLVWGGRTYSWASGHVIGALVAAAVVLAVFGLVERRSREPILPFEVLRNPIIAGSVACTALMSVVMFGTITYAPLFAQGVIGTSATSSGVVLTPLMLSVVVSSLITGQLVSRTGHYRWNVLLAPLVLAVGMALLWRMNMHTTSGQAARDMAIAGIGIGSMSQVFILSVQNAAQRSRMGAATALTQFARQTGSTLGVSLMGVIVNAGLPAQAATRGAGVAIHRLPPGLRESLAAAIRAAFLAATCVALLLWVVAAVWVREVPLRKGFDELVAAEATVGTPNPEGAD